jgi:uncharacterized Zn-binding protein involved in type VI secretion
MIPAAFVSFALLLSSPTAPQGSGYTERAVITGSQPSQFGRGLALCRDTLFAGDPGADGAGQSTGAVFVFERDGTSWIETQKLFPADGAQIAFGGSLAVSGTTLVVGAGGFPSGSPNTGAAYVFERVGSAWVERQKLLPGAATFPVVANFGASIDVDGDTIVVGSPLSDHSNPSSSQCNSGAAYVFRKRANSWVKERRLLASDLWCRAKFGTAVALQGDSLLVTADEGDPQGVLAGGSVYEFQRSGSTWAEIQEFGRIQTTPWGLLGTSVDLEGDRAIVGFRKLGASSFPGVGRAYTFLRSGTVWSQELELVASDGHDTDGFGEVVSISGPTALVSAHSALVAGVERGAAYVFDHDGTTWSEGQKLTQAVPVGPFFEFGRYVVLEGNRALVGAPRAGADGLVYVFQDDQARRTARRAAPNPDSYTASSPKLGASWSGTVDLSTTGHTFARLFGFECPTRTPLGGGQVLLGSGRLLFQSAPTAGPLASWIFAVPNDPSIVGRVFHTQAVHFGGATPFALSNAQDLYFGL